MYTMTWALLAAAMLALWWALGSEKRRVLPWGAFAVLCAAALATHYGAAIVLATWAMWLLVWALVSPQRWRRLGTLVLVGLATLVLLAPLTPVMMRQIPGYTNANLQLPSLVAYLGDLARAFTLGEYAPGLSGDGGRWLWLALLVFGAVVGLLVSIIGLPPLGGSWSKWYLLVGAADAEQWALMAVLLLSSLLNVAYLLPVPARGFFAAAPAGGAAQIPIREAPLACVVPLCLTAIGCLWLFFQADSLYALLAPITVR